MMAISLSNFQRDDGKCSHKDCNNPKAGCNLRLQPATLWPVQQDLHVWSNLSREYSECIMDRSPLKKSELLTPFVSELCYPHLQQYRDALHEENEAEDRNQQLFVYYDCRNTNYATDGERTSIAHEHLCWLCVIPQESYQCPNECAKENHQFLRPLNIHDIKISCVFYV